MEWQKVIYKGPITNRLFLDEQIVGGKIIDIEHTVIIEASLPALPPANSVATKN